MPGRNDSGPFANIARPVIFRHNTFHDLQHGFIQRAVDNLPFAGRFAGVQCGECAHAAIGRGQRITDGYAHAAGRAVGIAHDIAPSAHGFANAAKSGTFRIGARLAIARHAHDDQARVDRLQDIGAQPPFFDGAGLEILDQDIGGGDQFADQFLTFGIRKFADTAFLLRATTSHHSLSSPRPQLRIGSPWPGGSTLMTSAPMSPSNCPQKGPAINWPSSITRISLSAPVFSTLLRRLQSRPFRLDRGS